MDDDELWIPLISPRAEDEDGLWPLPEAETERPPPENWLAGASESLAPASHFSEDPATSGRFPMRRLMGRVDEVPDFDRIPRERWEAAMCTIPMHLREASIRGLQRISIVDPQLCALPYADLPPAPSDIARAEVRAMPRMAPSPAAERFRRASRQVNFRLTEDEYLDLASAAKLIGTTPTQLAGMLTRNGVQRVLQEANRQDG